MRRARSTTSRARQRAGATCARAMPSPPRVDGLQRAAFDDLAAASRAPRAPVRRRSDRGAARHRPRNGSRRRRRVSTPVPALRMRGRRSRRRCTPRSRSSGDFGVVVRRMRRAIAEDVVLAGFDELAIERVGRGSIRARRTRESLSSAAFRARAAFASRAGCSARRSAAASATAADRRAGGCTAAHRAATSSAARSATMPGCASGGAWLGVIVPQLPCEAPAPTCVASINRTCAARLAQRQCAAKPDGPSPDDEGFDQSSSSCICA